MNGNCRVLEPLSEYIDNNLMGILCIIASRQAPANVPVNVKFENNRKMVIHIRTQIEQYADTHLLLISSILSSYDGSVTIPCITTIEAELEVLNYIADDFGIVADLDGNSLLDECFNRWRCIDYVNVETCKKLAIVVDEQLTKNNKLVVSPRLVSHRPIDVSPKQYQSDPMFCY